MLKTDEAMLFTLKFSLEYKGYMISVATGVAICVHNINIKSLSMYMQ